MCKKGKLIVFEGIDGSGKSTQFKLLCEKLRRKDLDFRTVTFPQYSEPSSTLLRMYLAGDFGTDPESVNAYAATAFFAVDRFASYVQKWKEYYLSGGIILTDRYTTSNAVHQGSKLPPEEREKYFRWLYDFEFNLMGLPKPDMVIYMDIPVDISIKQMRRRETETNTSGDIHETDSEYLKKCAESGLAAADFYGWNRIFCTKNGEMRTIDDIGDEILTQVAEEING